MSGQFFKMQPNLSILFWKPLRSSSSLSFFFYLSLFLIIYTCACAQAHTPTPLPHTQAISKSFHLYLQACTESNHFAPTPSPTSVTIIIQWPPSFFPVCLGQPALWSSSLPSGSLKSLLHSKDKGILSKRKSGQVTTLTKVLQGCLKRNSTWGRAHKVLCYPTLSNLWLPGHFHLPSLLLHQGPPTTLAFLLALKHAKWGISQGFCSGDSLCPTSMLRVSPRTLTRSLPW